jgi:hypothetical protein
MSDNEEEEEEEDIEVLKLGIIYTKIGSYSEDKCYFILKINLQNSLRNKKRLMISKGNLR